MISAEKKEKRREEKERQQQLEQERKKERKKKRRLGNAGGERQWEQINKNKISTKKFRILKIVSRANIFLSFFSLRLIAVCGGGELTGSRKCYLRRV